MLVERIERRWLLGKRSDGGQALDGGGDARIEWTAGCVGRIWSKCDHHKKAEVVFPKNDFKKKC